LSLTFTGASGMDADARRKQLSAALYRVARGDRPALRLVYDMTAAKLFGVCLRILNDRSEAEDVLQDVYLTVWRKAASFDEARASPITWLVAIARNRAIDRLRSGGVSRLSEPIEAADAMVKAANVTLIGKKSFGKGSVQELISVSKDTAVKITVARWLTPAGHQINTVGIAPDIEVNMTRDDIDNKRDPQLDKALEILKEKNEE